MVSITEDGGSMDGWYEVLQVRSHLALRTRPSRALVAENSKHLVLKLSEL